jgi:hypothetical protein
MGSLRVRYGAPARAAVVIFSLAATLPGAATPFPPGGNKSDDRIELALRAWAYLPSGSFSAVNGLSLPIEVDTGVLLAALPSKAIDELETPFPADAQDLQNWIGRDFEPIARPDQ